jgi:transcriptional regulator with XRE-family HTH domain
VPTKSAKNLRARRSLGTAIKRMRAQKGLSQEALATACGLHRTYVGGIERGERNVSIDNIERISIALGCTVAELLSEER